MDETMNAQRADTTILDPSLVAAVPQDDWGTDRLGTYARAQHEAIEHDERSLTLHYWRLGLALNLARRHFSHGKWAKFLAKQGVNTTCSSKARAIHRTFKTEDDVAGLSVQEAYARRERTPPKSSHKRRKKQSPTGLIEWLGDISKYAESFLDEAMCANAAEAKPLLSAIDMAIDDLSNLRNCVSKRENES